MEIKDLFKTISCLCPGLTITLNDNGTESTFYFNESSYAGRGFTGVKSNYLYYMGKRQEADKLLKDLLATAIKQFAKRQMTWFRGMERKGIDIEWREIQ